MNNRNIFIGGLHRSGTSLLHKILLEHGDISGFENTGVPENEGQHLQTVFPAAKEFGGPGKFCFDSRSYMNENHDLISVKNAHKLYKEWSQYWNLDKKLLLEKSPPNLIRSRFIQALYPESYFIFIVRHPIAVSMATQKWSHTSAYELLKHWLIAHKILIKDIPHLKRSMIIRYEDMVLSTDTIMREIYDFLQLEYQNPNQTIKQEVNESYYAMWNEYLQTHTLQKMQIAFSSKLYHEFGYNLKEPYALDNSGKSSSE